MKMRPTANSDEPVSANRSAAHVARYTDRSSRRPKEQTSAAKNAQTEYETLHLSQNAAYSSTYGPGTALLDQQAAYRERRADNTKEDQRDVTRDAGQTEQKHKSVDTHDINSSRRRRSRSCVKLRLCCLRLCRAKRRCSERVMRKPRQLLQRIKARSKECRKPDDTTAVAGVSTVPLSRDAPKKSRRGPEDEAVEEVADRKDVSEDARKERKERRKREREERRERRKREEHVVARAVEPADARPTTRDDDLVVAKDQAIPVKPPLIADLAKTCCYLCVQNTLAIAAAASRPEQSDKYGQVSTHKFPAETTTTVDRSCSPILLVRTVQSFVRVRTRETGTLCPGTSAPPPAMPRAKKRKKFAVFPGLTRTKCPAGQRAACVTDKSRRDDEDARKKREPRNERCCGERNA
ncbi:PREDICTED: stress response protein nst1-like [Wasmannia auropunctata]|uniref:stress response protein nst1-like n=1 Tax=Wasmannia auropunctata TaxID=64793 RepID=UPI0005EF80DB|nr:PREDICTED: stress response protein nst1-like [Wasmannia auropunctata]